MLHELDVKIKLLTEKNKTLFVEVQNLRKDQKAKDSELDKAQTKAG